MQRQHSGGHDWEMQKADLTPSEHVDAAISEGGPTGDVCAPVPLLLFLVLWEGLAGTLTAALPSPPFSPEGLHQIEVGELVQIHKGMEHCQVQLFPGRTRTKSLTGRSLGGGREQSTGEAVSPLWHCSCLCSGRKFWPGPIAGLARGQGCSEHALARTACCHDPALVDLCKNDPHNARCPQTVPHTSDAHRWSPSTYRGAPMSPRCPQSLHIPDAHRWFPGIYRQSPHSIPRKFHTP